MYILVSFDVVGLYPHIRHNEVTETMRIYLDQRDHKQVSTDNLCKFADIILRQNYFDMGVKKYNQILETVIGTKFAPPYANIFVAALEKQLFE